MGYADQASDKEDAVMLNVIPLLRRGGINLPQNDHLHKLFYTLPLTAGESALHAASVDDHDRNVKR